MITLETARIFEAPADVVWNVVADVTGYADVVPGLSRAEVIAGYQEGMRRRCYDTEGRGWSETCTLLEEGRRYAFRVDTETYPFPLRQLLRRFEGTWSVEPVADGTRVVMRFEAEPRYGVLGRVLLRAMNRRAVRETGAIFDNWEEIIRARVESRNTRTVEGRVRPNGTSQA